MILIVDADNRASFAADLAEMFEQRKSVFVDQLGWGLRTQAGEERDDFDLPGTLYLLAKRAVHGPLLASARLLPTDQPHLMSEVFHGVCHRPPPTGVNVWEASRFCASPLIFNRRTRLELLWEIITGIMEASLLFGKDRITFTANRALLPLTLRCGWETTLLGPTYRDGMDEVTAVLAHVTPAGLRQQRHCFGLHRPVTRYIAPFVSAA